MTEDYFCYVIHDNTGVPVYVGKGRGRRASLKGRRNAKIEALITFGGTLPPVKVRENLTEADAFELEQALIAFHGRMDLGKGTLLNLCDGGPGSRGTKMSAETRAKWSIKRKGRKQSPELIAKRAAAARGKPKSAETRAKIAEKARGRPKSPETIAKIAASLTGKKQSPETIAKRAASCTGLKRTPEQCAANGDRKRGRRQPPEAIAKREATNRAIRLAKLTIAEANHV